MADSNLKRKDSRTDCEFLPSSKLSKCTTDEGKMVSKLPDLPKRSDFKSTEEFQEVMNKYYETHGLRLPTDFSEEEIKDIVEDCAVNAISPEVLSQKLNTTIFAIRNFVNKAGLELYPQDLDKYPDFPTKSDDMSSEEYIIILKKYYKNRKFQKDKKKSFEKKMSRKNKMKDEKKTIVEESTWKFDNSQLKDFPKRSTMS